MNITAFNRARRMKQQKERQQAVLDPINYNMMTDEQLGLYAIEKGIILKKKTATRKEIIALLEEQELIQRY